MVNINVLIKKIDQLPTIPSVIKRLVDLTADPSTDVYKILQLIERDQSLTVGILKLCNSAYYGLSTPVHSIKKAVMMLGFNTISNMCLTIGPSIYLRRRILIYGHDGKYLWRHSIAVASSCEQLAYFIMPELIEVAYTAGLLHDIGKLVIAECNKEIPDSILKLVEKGKTFTDAEKEMLGMDHGQIGSKLVRQWKFPSSLIDVIKYHHKPTKSGKHRDLSELTYMGNLISKKITNHDSNDSFKDLTGNAIFKNHKINEEQIRAIIRKGEMQLQDTEMLLNEHQIIRMK